MSLIILFVFFLFYFTYRAVIPAINNMIMIKPFVISFVLFSILANSCNNPANKISSRNDLFQQIEIKLPDPVYKSNISIEEALLKRRSVRRYRDEPLELKDISQLLWAAQGITAENKNGRTAPSAGAMYPLEIFVAAGHVNNLAPGVYRYQPNGHRLLMVAEGDKRRSLTNAAHLQGALNRSAAVLIIAAEYNPTTGKYAEKGTRYVHMEAGHAAQNICLQAVSLNIGTVTMGSFKDAQVKQILQFPIALEPLYLMPVGKNRD